MWDQPFFFSWFLCSKFWDLFLYIFLIFLSDIYIYGAYLGGGRGEGASLVEGLAIQQVLLTVDSLLGRWIEAFTMATKNLTHIFMIMRDKAIQRRNMYKRVEVSCTPEIDVEIELKACKLYLSSRQLLLRQHLETILFTGWLLIKLPSPFQWIIY